MERFTQALEFPEIIEAYRTSGEVDYMLRVVVPDMEAYDTFYKRLIEEVDLYDVSTNFVMEEMKKTTALPLTTANNGYINLEFCDLRELSSTGVSRPKIFTNTLSFN